MADIVQISEKKSQFDVQPQEKEEEKKKGEENSGLELEEETAGFTI